MNWGVSVLPARIVIGVFVLCIWSSVAWAETDPFSMSLEDLMDVPFYSASKKEERAQDAPAATYVITAKDIARSTANNIPELLRMVPGVQVARINSSSWSISIRGFNGRFSNKLLVLIDGRSVYNSIFSGVYWNVQDTMLEDIERIEVVRGPGGALWGANAVHGVINIITKNANDTQGVLASAGGGSEEKAFAALRYGHKFEDGAVRVYGKFYDRDESELPSGEDSFDAADAHQFGFRSDFNLSDEDTVHFQGNLFYAEEEARFMVPSYAEGFVSPVFSKSNHDGGNLLARWDRMISETSSFGLQAYYSDEERDDAIADIELSTFDIEAEYNVEVFDSHELSFGLGYRSIDDSVFGNGKVFSADPESRTTYVSSAHIQDDIQVTDSIRLILGSKFLHNTFTDFEVQPNIRSIWNVDDGLSIWGGISRAVRTPSRAERDLNGILSISEIPEVGPAEARLAPNRSFESENLLAYEAGVRYRLHDKAHIDLSTFYFDYDDIADLNTKDTTVGTSGGVPVLVSPQVFENTLQGESYGGEVTLDLEPVSWWRLQATYSLYKLRLQSGLPSSALESEESDGPENQATLRSLIDLPSGFELDAFFRYVDRLSGSGTDAYTELDLRLGWRATENISFSIIGTNLLDSVHNEFSDVFPTAVDTRQQRGVYGKVTAEF